METAKIAAALLSAAFLCGCRTICRPRFDIGPEETRAAVRNVSGGPYVVVEVRRFNLCEFACNLTSGKNYRCQEVVPGSRIMPELNRLFPTLFADVPDAVPVIVLQTVRSGAVAGGKEGFAAIFDDASGFNKNLSRRNRSDMASPAGFSPGMYLNGLVSTCSLFLVPLYGGGFSSHYEVSVMTGYDAAGESVSYSASTGFWTVSSAYAPFFPESEGWIHGDAMMNANPAPDATEAQKDTALCCAVAVALAKLSPEERTALRTNPVALLRDKETGGIRTFQLVQVSPERENAVERMGGDPRKPHIVSQNYDPATRRGAVVFDTSACPDEKAAVAWVRDEYLPRIASKKGRALDASAPADEPLESARVSVAGFKKEADAQYRIDFAVSE